MIFSCAGHSSSPSKMLYTFLISACALHVLFYTTYFNQLGSIWWRAQVVKLPTTHFHTSSSRVPSLLSNIHPCALFWSMLFVYDEIPSSKMNQYLLSLFSGTSAQQMRVFLRFRLVASISPKWLAIWTPSHWEYSAIKCSYTYFLIIIAATRVSESVPTKSSILP